jgi:hypothetical protein
MVAFFRLPRQLRSLAVGCSKYRHWVQIGATPEKLPPPERRLLHDTDLAFCFGNRRVFNCGIIPVSRNGFVAQIQ